MSLDWREASFATTISTTMHARSTFSSSEIISVKSPLRGSSKNSLPPYRLWLSGSGMGVYGRAFGNGPIHIGDADQDADAAVAQVLGEFDLVEIARRVVIDGGPEQLAQIAHVGAGRGS